MSANFKLQQTAAAPRGFFFLYSYNSAQHFLFPKFSIYMHFSYMYIHKMVNKRSPFKHRWKGGFWHCYERILQIRNLFMGVLAWCHVAQSVISHGTFQHVYVSCAVYAVGGKATCYRTFLSFTILLRFYFYVQLLHFGAKKHPNV